MADLSRDQLSKSKNNRTRNKEKHKERKHSSHHKDNDIENDSKHDFRANHKKDSPHKDSKHASFDRYDKKHDDRNIHFTKQSEGRHVSYRSSERNSHSSSSYCQNKVEENDDCFRNSSPNTVKYFNKYVGDNHNRSSYNETRHDDRRTNDERFVKFNRAANANDDEFVASLWQKIDYLSNQVDVLTQENERLKYSLSERPNLHDDPHAEVNITFRNKDFKERFWPILNELASDLIEGLFTVDELREFKFSRENPLGDKENLGDLSAGELFQLDNSTTESNENPRVPKYDTSFSEMLEDEDGKIQLNEKKSEKPIFRKVCFNCGEDHVISRCPHKIDYYKVANAKKQRFPPPTVRYHLSKGQGESAFKPGVLSNELREALGLKKDQIPSYIYRMRLINYPPGWLEEATIESSGIALYDSDGSVLRSEGDENAEFNMNRSNIRYDPAKFIDFPGFNVPLPPDCVDECYELGLPPMQEHHMRSNVEQHMPKLEIRPNRKRKLQLTVDNSTKVQRFDEDMDLDEDLGETFLQFTPPLPQETLPPPPPEDFPQPSSEEIIEIVTSHDSDSGTNTPMSDSIMEALAPVVERFKVKNLDLADGNSSLPSLKELEEMKKQLVMELGIVSECPSPSVQVIASDTEELNPNSDSRGSIPCHDSSNDLSNFSDCSLGSNPTEIKQSSGSLGSNPVDITQSSGSLGFKPDDITQLSGSLESNPVDIIQLPSSLGSTPAAIRQSSGSLGSSLAEIRQSSVTLQRSQSVCNLSKQMTLGTPSLSRHSSYQKLPGYDNFAKNVASHLNFENLPNSTGTYEKMKKVLKRVKEKFNALMP